MAIELTKARKRQMAYAASGALHATVNEKAGGLHPVIRVDPIVEANLSRKFGHRWHRDKDLVSWIKRNHPETAPVLHGNGLTFGYSGGEGRGKLANRFGRVSERFIPGHGWVTA